MNLFKSVYLFLTSLILAATVSASVSAQNSIDVSAYAKLQAAWVFNIARFIEIPDADNHQQFQICVVGSNANSIADYLNEGIKARKISNKDVVVTISETLQRDQACQVVYQTSNPVNADVHHDNAVYIMSPEAVMNEPSLFKLKVNANKIQIYLDKDNLRQSGVKVSPALLKIVKVS